MRGSRFCSIASRKSAQHAAVPVVRERHRVGAGAAAACFGLELDATVPSWNCTLSDVPSSERRALGADQLDALGKPGIGRRRGVRRRRARRSRTSPPRTARSSVSMRCTGVVRDEALHLRRSPAKAQQQIERVDALREQHAAAVARLRAAARLVVVALRPPVGIARRAETSCPSAVGAASRAASPRPAGSDAAAPRRA